MSEMMPDFDPDDEDSGILDEKVLVEIIEKVRDVVRPLGLTLVDQGITFQYNQGQNFLMLPCIVRKSAKEKVQSDKEAREAFNKMMAEQNEAKIQEEAENIRASIQSREVLEDILFGGGSVKQCAHERKHPSGFCLDCGEGLED